MDDLDVVVPSMCVRVEGIEVRPLVVRQLSAFARTLKALPEDLMTGLTSGNIDAWQIARHCDVFAEAVAIATSSDRKLIDDMTPDQLVRLVGAVLEVNLDFFVHRLAPALNGLADTGMRLIARAGQRSSSDSSSTATAAPISSITP